MMMKCSSVKNGIILNMITVMEKKGSGKSLEVGQSSSILRQRL